MGDLLKRHGKGTGIGNRAEVARPQPLIYIFKIQIRGRDRATSTLSPPSVSLAFLKTWRPLLERGPTVGFDWGTTWAPCFWPCSKIRIVFSLTYLYCKLDTETLYRIIFYYIIIILTFFGKVNLYYLFIVN